MRLRYAIALTLALAIAATLAFAQAPAPPASPVATPAAPASPVSAIRNKISAGDLLSAESLAEVWRTQHGQDGAWLVGYSWLARGALLMGDDAKATFYADSTRAYCDARAAAGAKLADDGELEYALGSAIEVKAQLLAKQRGAAAAAEYLRAQLALFPAPLSLRTRIYKRLALLTLVGSRAPDFENAEPVRGGLTRLATLQGKPVLLFVYSSTCGDCKASAATLARVAAKHGGDSVRVVALTRWYNEESERPRERTVVDSTWSAVYKGLENAPVVVSAESMERYGGSSTPTFVFIDRRGIVRGYTPTRLTEAEFEKAIVGILK